MRNKSIPTALRQPETCRVGVGSETMTSNHQESIFFPAFCERARAAWECAAHSSEMSPGLWQLLPLQATVARVLNRHEDVGRSFPSRHYPLHLTGVSCDERCPWQKMWGNELIPPSDCSWAPQITSLIKSWAVYSPLEERLGWSCWLCAYHTKRDKDK